MSYILDALRKADAERERDPARGIHAQPLAAQQPSRRPPLAAWAGAGLVAVAVAAYAWSQGGDSVPAPVAAMPVPTPAVIAPVAPPRVITVANSVQPAAPPPLPVVVKAAPAKVAEPAKAAASAAAATAEAPAERIYAQTELPPDVQHALPKLAISGGVYSENVAQRMLIVGGQVVGEGAELAPGLVLERIRAHNVVLKFRGYKYSVIY